MRKREKKRRQPHIYIIGIITFLIVGVLMSNMLLGKAAPKATKLSLASTLQYEHFCYHFHQQLHDFGTSFDYCYAHPITAVKQSFHWYWINENRLQHYLTSHNLANNTVPDPETNIDTSKYTDIVDEQTNVPDNLLNEHQPVVYLTFDDGPGKYTDQVLDILKEEEIKATFFVLGIQVERHPLFTQRIVDDGHSLGNHTYDHEYKKIYKSFDTFANQVIDTNRIIYELTGEKVTLFRAPGGSINNLDEGYFTALHEAGFKVFDWNIDSKDSQVRGIKKEGILSIIKESHLFDPAIVLLHDTNSHEQSMLALKEIIAYYKDQNYQFAAITEQTDPYTFNLGKNLNWSRNRVTSEQIEQFKNSIEALYN